MEKVATPDAFKVPVPKLAVPSRNITVPVGVPEPDEAVTVAVSVTLWPVETADADAVSAVALVLGGVTAAVCRKNVLPATRSIFPLPLRSYAASGPWPVTTSVANKGSTVPLVEPGRL